jgi:hypothetical protein
MMNNFQTSKKLPNLMPGERRNIEHLARPENALLDLRVLEQRELFKIGLVAVDLPEFV